MSRTADIRALPTVEGPTLAQAVSTGSYLDILLAQRRSIVEALPDQRGPATAALHRQLTLLSKEIEAIRTAEADADSVVARTPDEPCNPSAI